MARKKGQIIRRGTRTPVPSFVHPTASIMGLGDSSSSWTNPRKLLNLANERRALLATLVRIDDYSATRDLVCR
jgi:hypothetical protein